MKHVFFALIVMIGLVSCKKKSAASADEITYEIQLVNATSWHGSYLNENAQIVGIENGPDHWRYTFKNSKNLVVLNLTAYADGSASGEDVYMTIYKNGNAVAYGYSSSFPQLQYVYP